MLFELLKNSSTQILTTNIGITLTFYLYFLRANSKDDVTLTKSDTQFSIFYIE